MSNIISNRHDNSDSSLPLSYLDIAQLVARQIETDFPDGGRLPPSRTMIRYFNTTPVTYNKAIEILRRNALVYTTPGRVGTFICPRRLWPKKLGLIIGNGEYSPHITHIEIIPTIFTQLHKAGYSVQIIQAPTDKISGEVQQNFLQGVLALWPTAKLFPILNTIQNVARIPVVAVNIHFSEIAGGNYDFAFVNSNKANYYRVIFTFLAARGHEKVLFLTSPHKNEVALLLDIASQCGFTMTNEHLIAHWQLQREFINRFNKIHPTAMMVEGTALVHRLLAEQLAVLPIEKHPQLLLHDSINMELTALDNVIGLANEDLSKIGTIAVNNMITSLTTCETPQTVYVDAGEILPLSSRNDPVNAKNARN